MKLHHIEIVCKCIKQRIQEFVGSLGSTIVGRHAKENAILLQLGPVKIVLKESKFVHRDTVENVAFEVESVQEICQNVVNFSDYSPFLQAGILENTKLSREGVDLAIIKSPVGNVKHTIFNKENFTGFFLPGFIKQEYKNSYCTEVTDDPVTTETKITKKSPVIGIDHVAFAVEKWSSFLYMDWYEKCFKFSRQLLSGEDAESGLTVKTDNGHGKTLGLRLTVLKEHLCSEEALILNESHDQDVTKFVFGEALDGQGPNQIDTFLSEHEGPGIQHIGFLTEDICNAAIQWKNSGVMFLTPPTQYYNEVKDIMSRLPPTISALKIQKHGILVDAEDFDQAIPSFLLQLFTEPLFDRKTFFLELIQRSGAVGFGAGNIAALFRAVEAYLRENGGALGCDSVSTKY